MGLFRRMLMLIVFLSLMAGGQADAMKRYDSRSGYVKYEGSTGSEELYWDNYGEQEARYRNTSVTVFGMTQTDNSVDIIDGDWVYNYRPKEGTATKYNYSEMMNKMSDTKASQPREFSEAMIKQWGGEKVGTEKILGKKTEIYKFTTFGDYKVWLYKKTIPLKMEVKTPMFNMTNTAIEFKENARVDSAKFKLPSNVQIVEGNMGEMPTAEEMQAYRKQMENLQNDPEYQESMRQMQEMQNSPEFQDAMKQMKEMQNNPEYQDALRQMQNMQQDGSFTDALKQAAEAQQQQGGNYQAARAASGTAGATGGDLVTDSVDIMKDEASTAVKDGVRQKTKDILGGGLKKFLN